ncbi:DUF4145 domain-containing protein [Pseudomonas syringae]|uniref:DUF4145 domain-containing protein n=1 Tax=Pseudomonas syringae TaxID=317 RepID=A0A085V5Q8_PSESX|nr:DUF4145 domain-containing protein [Pseudomonas syringae]KFE50771.1 hypothetical protein IV02_15195 [Pseudomonas syringae]
MHKYVPASFHATAFNCPHCGAYAQFKWSPLRADMYIHGTAVTGLKVSLCGHCDDPVYWEVGAGDPSGGRMIIPQGSVAPHPHPDMPTEVKADYNEARAIFNESPRAAAALLRLSMQRLCIVLGEPGKNINDDIGSLVKKGLPAGIQKALDVVRVVGNNAVHPGKLSDEDLVEVAIPLFELINVVVEDRISRPKALEELYQRLPQGARDAVDKRDA